MDIKDAIALTDLSVKLGYSKPKDKAELVLEIVHNLIVLRHLDACDDFKIEDGKLMGTLLRTKTSGNPKGSRAEIIVSPQTKTA